MQHEPPGGSLTSTPTACPCRPLPVWRLRYVREYSIYGCRDAKPIRDVFEPSVESSPVSCVVSHLAHSSVCSDSDETSRSPGLSALSSRLPRVSRPSRLVLVKRSHFSHAPVGCVTIPREPGRTPGAPGVAPVGRSPARPHSHTSQSMDESRALTTKARSCLGRPSPRGRTGEAKHTHAHIACSANGYSAHCASPRPRATRASCPRALLVSCTCPYGSTPHCTCSLSVPATPRTPWCNIASDGSRLRARWHRRSAPGRLPLAHAYA